MWQQWINGILGLWVIVVPYLGLTSTQFAWTLTITGIVIAILGFWGATEHVTSMGSRRMTHA